MYVFDTSPLSSLFKKFYRRRFPTLWQQFDALVADRTVTSTREVRRELDLYAYASEDWIRDNGAIFTMPTAAEALFIRQIYAVTHFQQNIEMKKIQKGGLNADPFVIAKAGKPLVKVVALDAPGAGQMKRLGFLGGRFRIPEDFDRMADREIGRMFGIKK